MTNANQIVGKGPFCEAPSSVNKIQLASNGKYKEQICFIQYKCYEYLLRNCSNDLCWMHVSSQIPGRLFAFFQVLNMVLIIFIVFLKNI